MDDKKIYREALETFGHASQVKKLFEEMAELQEAICKAVLRYLWGCDNG